MSLPLLPAPTSPPAPDVNVTITPNNATAPPASQPSSGLPPPSTPSPPPPSTVASVPQSSSGLPKGALAGLIVGIVIGAVMVMIGVGIFVFIYRRRKRKRKRKRGEYGSEYYSGGPPQQGSKDNLYAGQPQQWQQNVASTDNKVMVQPPPAPPPGVALYPQASPMLVHSYDAPPSSGSLGSEKPSHGMTLGLSQNSFSYEELAAATNNFSSINILGQGGFGYVHKGVLPNGKEVAIKQLKAGSGQGEREFQAEVDIIGRVHHKHLVSLVGYCMTGAQRMLVYEFVPNRTLEFHLHGSGNPTMDWPTRMKIALGSAKGLAYLHEDCQPKIIHRDIKAANILLDSSFEAKVADFGLAKSSLDTDTHVSTRVMGTFGYMAPEYAASGKLTEKSDVFSFGVVLLELITGRRPIDKNQSFTDDSMVDWARPLLAQAMETKNFDALADPRLEKDYNSTEMARMVACAAACVRHSARRRPQMSQIVRALEGNIALEDLNVGLAPGHSAVFSSFGSSDYDNSQYKEDMKKFRMLALGSSQEHATSESGFTSEVHISASSSEGQQTTQEADLGRTKNETQIQIDDGS